MIEDLDSRVEELKKQAMAEIEVVQQGRYSALKSEYDEYRERMERVLLNVDADRKDGELKLKKCQESVDSVCVYS